MRFHVLIIVIHTFLAQPVFKMHSPIQTIQTSKVSAHSGHAEELQLGAADKHSHWNTGNSHRHIQRSYILLFKQQLLQSC